MKNYKAYVVSQLINWLSVAAFTLTAIGDLSFAFRQNSIVIRLVYMIMTILMFGLAKGSLNNARMLRERRRKALILEEWGNPVPADHGATMSEVIMNIRNEEVEYVAFFTESGQKLCESTINCPRMTTIRDEDQDLILQHPRCIMVHNHPGAEPIAFSPEDLVALATGVCQRSIVVTPTVGYIMEAPDNFYASPKAVARLGRRYYCGQSAEEASFNFCLAAAAYFGWTFGIIMPTCDTTELKK